MKARNLQKAANESELIVVGHGNAVTALSLSGDGKILASGSHDGTVIVWDIETGVMRRLLRSGTWVSSLILSPDGTTLVCDSGHTWDASSGRLLRRSYRYSAPLACSPDGRLLACTSLKPGADGFSLLVTSLRTGRTLSQFPWGQDDPYAVAFSSDGRLLAAASYDGQAEQEDHYIASVIDLKTGDRRTFQHTEKVILFGIDLRTGVRLVAVSPDGSQLWNAETGERLRTVTRPDPPPLPRVPQCVCLSPDGRLLATGADYGVVSVWSVATSERLWQQQAHVGWVREIAITCDGRTMATAGEDQTVRLWDAWIGTPGHMLGGRGAAVEAVAFAPDGQAITALSADGTARLWRIAPPACERREMQPGVLAREAPRKPDTARNLWNMSADNLPLGPELPSNATIAAVSPDGSLIALCGQYQHTRLFAACPCPGSRNRLRNYRLAAKPDTAWKECATDRSYRPYPLGGLLPRRNQNRHRCSGRLRPPVGSRNRSTVSHVPFPAGGSLGRLYTPGRLHRFPRCRTLPPPQNGRRSFPYRVRRQYGR